MTLESLPCGLVVELEEAPSRTSGPAQQQARGPGCELPRRTDKHFPWLLLLFLQEGAFTSQKRGCLGHGRSLTLTTGLFHAGWNKGWTSHSIMGHWEILQDSVSECLHGFPRA